MKKLNIMCLSLIIALIIPLAGCAKLDTENNSTQDYKKYINADKKTLSKLKESFSVESMENKANSQGIDIEYSEFSGNMDVLSLYVKESSKAVITYNSSIKGGNARLVLIDANKEVTDIVKNKGNGSINVNLSGGKSVIKCIGDKATGNIKIDVSFSDTPELGQFEEDGIFVLWNCKRDGDALSGSIMRVKVVNKRADKIAKINLNGKLQGDKGIFAFGDDGWGNSGSVEFQYLMNNRVTFTIDLTDDKSKSAEWGMEEGTFISDDKPLPSYLNGL